MSGEEAVTDVIGSILLVGITVAVMVGLSIMLVGFLQPDDQVRADLELAVHPGHDGWGTGDETVRIRHLGGEPVPQSGFRVVVVLNGTSTVFQGSALDAGGGWDDGQLTTGETWSTVTTIPFRSLVELAAIDDHGGRLLNTAVFTALGQGAVAGGAGPTAPTADFTAACTLLVCDFTDTSVDDGTIEAWSWDFAGTGTSTAQDPTHVFLAPGSYAVTLTVTDDEGRTDDVTRNIVAGGPLLTYVDCPMTAHTGSVLDCPDAQDAADADAAAGLTESQSVSIDGQSASKAGGSGTASDAAGAPDDLHYILSAQADWVEVADYDTAGRSGGIATVELVFEGHAQGRDDETVDFLADDGAGNTVEELGYVPADGTGGADDEQHRFDITALHATWTWQDVQDLKLRATYEKEAGQPVMDLHVDAIWVEVTPSPAAWSLEVEAAFSDVPAGASYDLSIRYRATGDTFDVEVWDGSAWNDRGDLTAASLTTFEYSLDEAGGEYNGGQPRIRFVDQGTGGGQGTLEIEYARVETA